MEIPGPDAPLPGAQPSSVYVRPHDFEVTRERNGKAAWTARIQKLTPLGGLVRLDVVLLDGTLLHVQLSRETSVALELAQGEHIFIAPKDLKFFHDSKAFVENYVI
jgi:sulfate transport system ATP-binding protein